MFRFVILYILEYLIVTLVRFVLLLLLFNFVTHCIISTVVVAFEINYLILSYLGVAARDLCVYIDAGLTTVFRIL